MQSPPTPTAYRLAAIIQRRINLTLTMLGIKVPEESPAQTVARHGIAELIDFETGARTSRAVLAFADERNRVRAKEGFSEQHDDAHTGGELADAAACYAMAPLTVDGGYSEVRRQMWPWEPSWWKPTPTNRKREIEKAGALLLAEWDRLDRLERKPVPGAKLLDLDASEVLDVWRVTISGERGGMVCATEAEANSIAHADPHAPLTVTKTTMTRGELNSLSEFGGF